MSEVDISSWSKAKDAALVGFVALVALLAMKILGEVADLKKDIAVYQANMGALKAEQERLASELSEHMKESRQMHR